MRTIICNIMNLDAITAVGGLQNVVRTIVSRERSLVVRGVVRSVRHSEALLMRLMAGAKAQPAYAAKIDAAARHTAMEQASAPCTPWQAGFLSRFASRSGRASRG